MSRVDPGRDEIDALRAEVAALRSELAQLRRRLPNDDLPVPAPAGPIGRRHLLGLAGAALAGSAASLAARPPQPAAAADGAPLTLGQANTSSIGTTWTKSTSNATDDFVLGVRVPSSSTSAGLDLAIDGSGTGIEIAMTRAISVDPAIHAVSAGRGNAIEGETTNVTQGLSGVKGTTSGVAFGVHGESTSASTSGGGVFGSTAGANTAVLGDHLGESGTAVFGRARSTTGSATAVRGQQDGLGTAARFEIVNAGASAPAMEAITAGIGAGVAATSAGGVGVVASGGAAALRLVPTSAAGPPAAGSHLAGELVVDATARLFLCVTAGTPGGWVELGAAGLTLLAAPQRAFDSRPAEPPGGLAAGAKGLFQPGEIRTIDLSASGGLPLTATRAIVNVTLTETVGAGFVTIWSAAVPSRPLASTVNWSGPGTNIANTTLVAVDQGRIKVYAHGPTHVVVDVIGY